MHRSLGSTYIEQKILSGETDFGVSILFRERKLIERKELLQESHVFCVSKKYAKLSVEELIKSRLVVDFTDNYPCFTPWLAKNHPDGQSRLLRKHKPSVLVPNHYEAIKILKNEGGVAILPRYLAHGDLVEKTIKQYSSKASSLTVGLDLAWLKNRTLSTYEKQFVKHCSDIKKV